MKRKCSILILTLGVLVLLWMVLWPVEMSAAPGEADDKVIYAVAAKEKPTIDGVLDEKVWQNPSIRKNFISYEPLYGEQLPLDTLVWAAYDRKNLYFAFLCRDPEPGKIKTSITKRDNMFGDDWVSVAIDAMGNGQSAYVLHVNPNGIQGDSLTTAQHTVDDIAPDFVWESAAQLTDEGYQVEIALPLKSIKFKSGKEVAMGLLLRRRISRMSYVGAWPEIKVNHWILDSQARIIYPHLRAQQRFEVLPSLTHSDGRERVSPEQWEKSGRDTEFGIDFKYGVTSSTVAAVTINPDFNQVESDAFQVEVNQRYPLFYTEKRPFFMEGTEIFNFWTYPYGFFPKAMHTRQIVDPGWGAKLVGSAGKFSFGVLSAGDEAPGRPWEDGTNPNEGDSAFYGILRGKYSLGSNDYVGFLYSGRGFGDEYNHVLGVDSSFRFGKRHWVRSSFIHSMSRDSQGQLSKGRSANYGTFVYTYGSKRMFGGVTLEHSGRELQVDSGYLQRNGINVCRSGLLFYFYPKKKNTWLKQIATNIGFDYTHDLNTHMDDLKGSLALTFYFIKEATLQLIYSTARENWKGLPFDLGRWKIAGAIRLTNWLKMNGSFVWRERIYYYADPPFSGKGYEGSFSLDIQPNNKLNQYFSFTHSDLTNQGEKLYDVNIFYSRTTYQFNRYFFLRAVLQYDSYDKLLLTDFLASVTLIPGTVLHVGYGGLYENRDWVDERWLLREGNMINVKRSFFAKISYLWRF